MGRGELGSNSKSIEEAAKKTDHTTKAERKKRGTDTPKAILSKEMAAARSTRPIERKILRKQARKARADHAVQCCLLPGKRIPKRKALTELYVNGIFTEDREEWQKELQRHCDEVYVDALESKEEQERRIVKYSQDGNMHFSVEGRVVEITVDVVLQAKAKMSENKVNGPDDVIVSEMIKQLPQEKVYEVTRCFQQRFMGKMDATNSWKIVKLVF